MRQIALDVETTGLEVSAGHRVIEIGCVELVKRRLTGNVFHVYINPERDIPAEAAAVHGISIDFLKDKPLFSAVAQEFCAFVQDAELIIHNAPFDTGFLTAELKRARVKTFEIQKHCTVLDTLPLARQLHPGQKNNLDALCKRYGVNSSHREFHGALLDAELLAHVYLAMTGGQSTLFSEEKKHVSATETRAQKPARAERSKETELLVTTANEVELSQHEKFMQLLAKQKKS